MIDPNKVITDGPDTGKTHAMVWAESFSNNPRELSDDDFLFASQITKATLNHIIEDGRGKGKSVAYWLAVTKAGQDLLVHSDYELGLKISAKVLNHIIPEGQGKGESVAFWLAHTRVEFNLLAINNYLLGSQIDEATLNHRIKELWNKGQSVAYWLAASRDGQALLARGNFALGSQIDEATLNHIIKRTPYQEESAAFLLAKTEEGQALLRHNNYALGKLIINRAERAPDFKEGPRYFEDPKILLEFMKKFPDRRGDIEKEAPGYVEQLRRFSRLRETCKELNGFDIPQGVEVGVLDHLEIEQIIILSTHGLLSGGDTSSPDYFVNRESKHLCSR